MKKKLALLFIASTLVFSACGKETPLTDDSTAPETSSEEVSESTSSENAESSAESEDLSKLDAIGDITVDEGLLNVELTIPSEYIGEQTQEDLDKICDESGYKSITLNDDGSATYVMSKKQHKEMMEELQESINSSLSELVGSDGYPNITEITSNDDFTAFTITTKSTELDMNESFSVLAFYMYGGMYNIFNGTPVDNISVTFVNADTGEVISTTNSSDAAQ